MFKGFGAWWDVYDWSPTFTNNRQKFGLRDIDRLADAGVQTLYIQTSTYRHPDAMLDSRLMRQIIDNAHRRGMRVVGWYLPEFNDAAFDLDRLLAIAGFGFDGLGIDIESTANPDVAARTRNLLTVSTYVRGAHPNLPLAAIPVTPVIWEGLNRSWWPNFPYRQMATLFDAWMPMAYWSFRACSFTDWNDPYRYIYESVVQLRSLTGNPNLPVHPIGGQAAPVSSDTCRPRAVSNEDIFWMNVAMTDSGAIGGSIYDDASTASGLYDSLHIFRRELVK